MRLIDADKFLSDESEAYMSAQNQITDEKLIVVNEVVHKKMQMLIADIPTVDAVPVVRCKDCKYWKVVETIIGFDFVCTAQGDMKVSKDADDFCSWGERKEDV